MRSARNQLSRRHRAARNALAWMLSSLRRADVALFHEFAPPPSGGGHQFLRALQREFERRGLRVENNSISPSARACLYNSFNFDFDRLRIMRRNGCRMVHRVDGPIGEYRGWDDGTDRRIYQVNHEMADATIFQSHYSMRRHLELGFEFKSPRVIMNAVDPTIFNPAGRVPFERTRRTRIISVTWSDNPGKGAVTYRWLEDHLDWDRFEYSYVGRSQVQFDRVRVIPPVTSTELAGLLRQHDIYLTASRNDPCSNSLLEALSCGLPALYLDSGGHPEIVGEAGLAFQRPEQLPDLLERIVDEFEERQARISIPSLSEVAERYLEVMGMERASDGEDRQGSSGRGTDGRE